MEWAYPRLEGKLNIKCDTPLVKSKLFQDDLLRSRIRISMEFFPAPSAPSWTRYFSQQSQDGSNHMDVERKKWEIKKGEN